MLELIKSIYQITNFNRHKLHDITNLNSFGFMVIEGQTLKLNNIFAVSVYSDLLGF
jgi:hypothetical protein